MVEALEAEILERGSRSFCQDIELPGYATSTTYSYYLLLQQSYEEFKQDSIISFKVF
jgi:hypothetical protein